MTARLLVKFPDFNNSGKLRAKQSGLCALNPDCSSSRLFNAYEVGECDSIYSIYSINIICRSYMNDNIYIFYNNNNTN